MTELVKKKWVKIEDLGTMGDLGGIRLSTIFAEVSSRYEREKGARLLHWSDRQEAPSRFASKGVVDFRAVLDRQILSELNSAEERAFAIPDTEGLTYVFQSGRLLDDQCLASRKTEQYLMLQNIVNDVLAGRGFQDIHVY